MITGRLRRAFMAAGALACLGLIMWVGVMAWQRPCRQAGLSLLTSTATCPSLFEDSPLLIALGLWVLGVLVWMTGTRLQVAAVFLLGAAVVAVAQMDWIKPQSGARLFYILLPWLAPLIFHFPFALLDRPPRRIERGILIVLTALAIAGSLPFVLLTTTTLQQRGLYIPLRMISRLVLVVALVLIILALVHGYRQSRSPAVRRRVRLITTSTILAIAPFLLLSLLPDTFGLAFHVTYVVTLPWLLLIPGSYVYSLFRHRLAGSELRLDRAAVYYLLTVLLLSGYLFGNAVLDRSHVTRGVQEGLDRAVLVVALVYLFVYLQRAAARLVRWSLWGDEFSYADVLSRLTASLAVVLDRETLRHLLVDDMVSTLRLARISLFLTDGRGRLRLVDMRGNMPEGAGTLQEVSNARLVAYLVKEAKPLPGVVVREALSRTSQGSPEPIFLSDSNQALWVPLVSRGVLQGLLLIWPRPEDGFFTPDERRILGTLGYQAAIAAHNMRLVEEMRAGREELARAHRQLLMVREHEQRELAHDLHDSIVQDLLGLSYQVAGIRQDCSAAGRTNAKHVASLEKTRQGMLQVIGQLRGLIRDLQPAGLEELGLTSALDGYVAHVRSLGGPQLPDIQTDLRAPTSMLPDAVALCGFRVAQEALRNALYHAHAHNIRLSCTVADNALVVVVSDDGDGFQVPTRLSEFALSDHFGLVGLSERVAWAGGQLSIHSQPGRGTSVEARIPLATGESSAGQTDKGAAG